MVDAFYASVEQRDDPDLRGHLVVVACHLRVARLHALQGCLACGPREENAAAGYLFTINGVG